MNSKQFQFNRRSVVSLALAVLILVTTAIPTLAWEEEDGSGVQPVRSCQVNPVSEELSTAACADAVSHPPKQVVSQQPITLLGVIQAEKMFLLGWQRAQVAVEAH